MTVNFALAMRDFVIRNKLLLLFLALVAAQLLTWRAVVSLGESVDSVRWAIVRNACGGTGAYDSPCRVSVVNR